MNPTGGSANSIAQLNIFDASQRTILETADACSGIMGGCASVFPTTCITDCSSVSVDTIALVNSGDLIMVTLNASASLAGAHSAAATVDPFFKIDPTFPLADEFSIVLSPGIGNPIPSERVPEPSSLTLFAAAVARNWGSFDVVATNRALIMARTDPLLGRGHLTPKDRQSI